MLNSNYLHLDGGGIFNEVDYYHWLLHLVCADSEPYINYLLLLQTLHKKDYIWTNPNDMNRVQDAYSLRKEYMQNERIFVDENGDVPAASVLEVLIALSYRCECDIMGEPGLNHPARWFWMAVQNLDLMKCTDDHFDRFYVDQQVDRWLEGKYKRNGQGGPFPLQHPNGDQRHKQLWDQLLEFVMENYYSTI